MSVKSCDKLEKSMVELTVEVSAEDFEAAIEKAYRKQRGQIRMPGFRPGKAPRKMIERAYGEGVFYEEAVNIILPDAYADAVKEQELDVVGYPKVELLNVGKEGFSFKATVAVYPEVTLGQYKGVEAPKSEVHVSDEDVENHLKTMADRNSRMVDQDRESRMGDIVNIDFKGYLNGAPFEGGEGTNYDLTLGSGQFVPGFEEQVAELDDDFAMDVSEFDTLDELREDVRKKLTGQREEAVKQEFENVLMDKVADGIQADIPEDMIENRAHSFVEGFARQLMGQGMTMEQYLQMTGSNEDALLEQAMEPAKQQVRLDLAVSAIIKAENIEVSDEEVAAEFQRQADEVKMDVETLKKYMEEPVVREQLLRNKAIAVVVDSAVAVKPELKEGPAGTPAEEQQEG